MFSLANEYFKPGLFQVKLAGSFDAEWVKLGSVQVKGLPSFDPE